MGSRCRSCAAVRARADYEKHQEKRKAKQQAWRERNPEAVKRQSAGRVNDPASNLRHWLRRKYGLTVEQYEGMVQAQGGVCLTCQQACTRHARLSVDHDHETGQVRGLLCDRCNKVLGMVEDSPALLANLADYLRAAKRR